MKPVRSTERRWSVYAVTGGALLGLAAPSQAAIVYSGLLNIESSGTTDLNFNGDAFPEYQLSTVQGFGFVQVNITSLANQVVSGGGGLVAALPAGTLVDSSSPYLNDTLLLQESYDSFKKVTANAGNWPDDLNDPRFVGLIFGFGDGYLHFGWARIGATTDALGGTASYRLYDWAYEDTPSTGIIVGDVVSTVPEPSSMALFALGAAGIAALKRRRQA